MTIGPEQLSDEQLTTRLDALGRTLASESAFGAASGPPSVFISAVHRKRTSRALRRVYGLALAAAGVLVAGLAIYFYPSAVTKPFGGQSGGLSTNIKSGTGGAASVGSLRRALYENPEADVPVVGGGTREKAETPMGARGWEEGAEPKHDKR